MGRGKVGLLGTKHWKRSGSYLYSESKLRCWDKSFEVKCMSLKGNPGLEEPSIGHLTFNTQSSLGYFLQRKKAPRKAKGQGICLTGPWLENRLSLKTARILTVALQPACRGVGEGVPRTTPLTLAQTAPSGPTSCWDLLMLWFPPSICPMLFIHRH